ncbi:MAG: hypothetical protein AB1631_27570 [Acidobacteriota bacterium]
MNGMRKLAVAFWILSLLVPCAGQKDKDTRAPDLSGKWILDTSKSKFDSKGRGSAYISTVLVISHNEPELRIIRTFISKGREQSEELTYYTDGRGETNKLAFTIRDLKTRTRWEKGNLVSKWTWTSDIGNDNLFTDGHERREMSADGRVLAITYSISGISGLILLKLVFNRDSK